ncbi:MAG TPA: PGPGW domain-containing protein [Dokdonella sp.]
MSGREAPPRARRGPLARLRSTWRAFRALPAGTRFRRVYERRRGRRGGWPRRVLVVAAGCAALAAGVAMLVLPGPGLLVMLLGAGLIAGESLVAARLLDRIDLAVERGVERWRAWRRRRG